MKNNKGITLIALIITIIVMMILVAVTVAVVVNSDLIGTAQGAKANTEAHAVNDQTYGMNVTIKGELYESVNDYVRPENGGEENSPIQVAENPTHKFYIAGLTFLIDSNTTYKQCVDASRGVIAFGTPIEHTGGTTITIYKGTEGGALCAFDYNNYQVPTWMRGTIGETEKIFTDVLGEDNANFLAFAGEEEEAISKLLDYNTGTFNVVKQLCEENGYLFGYVEEI